MGEKDRRRSRRRFLIGTAALAAGALLGKNVCFKPGSERQDITLEEARADPSLRQEYLERRLKGLDTRNLEFLRYDHTGEATASYLRAVGERHRLPEEHIKHLIEEEKPDRQSASMHVTTTSDEMFNGEKKPLFVHPSSFDRYYVRTRDGEVKGSPERGEFLHYRMMEDFEVVSLLFHELVHVNDFSEGMRIGDDIINSKTVDMDDREMGRAMQWFAEVRAYDAQFWELIRKREVLNYNLFSELAGEYHRNRELLEGLSRAGSRMGMLAKRQLEGTHFSCASVIRNGRESTDLRITPRVSNDRQLLEMATEWERRISEKWGEVPR